MSVLVDLATGAVDRPGVAIGLVIGDPGSGKSRFLEELMPRCEVSSRFRVVGYETQRGVPLASARHLLNDLSSLDPDGRQLRDLLQGAPRDHMLEPVAVFEAVHRCSRSWGPTLIVVDDLQWVDRQTTELLQYLIRDAQGTDRALIVVAASRPAPGLDVVRDSLRSLVSSGSVAELNLRPLERQDGLRLLRGLTPTIGHGDAERLWERSEGSPFWLELLAHDPSGETRPNQLINSRLSTATSDATTLLATLAVAARPTSTIELSEWLEWDHAKVEVAIDELLATGLVVRLGSGVRVAHDLIREAVATDMPTVLEQRLHVRLAEWLEGEAGDDIRLLREALEHRRASQTSALDAALRLLRSRRRRLLPVDDLRLLAAVADDTDASELEVDQVRWEIASLAGEVGAPAFALERWRLLLPRITDPTMRARGLLRASHAASQLEDEQEALNYLDECRSTGVRDPILEIEVDAHAANVMRNSLRESDEAVERAVSGASTLVSAVGGVELLGDAERGALLAALRAQSFLMFRNEDFLGMLKVAEERVAAARAPVDQLEALLDSALAMRSLGRYEESERRSRQVLLEARRQVLPRLTFHAIYMLANALYRLGKLDEARVAVNEAIELTERAGVLDPSWLSASLVLSRGHEIDISQRDWKDGIEAVAALTRSERDPHFRLHLHMLVSTWLARFSGPDAADGVLDALTAGQSDADTAGCQRCASEFMIRAAESHVRTGRAAEAKKTLTSWDSIHPDGEGELRLWRDHAAALIARQDSFDDSRRGLEEVIEKAAATGARLDEIWAKLDLGDMLTGVDGDHAAVVLLDAARMARDANAKNELGRAEKMLRSLGVRTWRREASLKRAEALTSREVEIARLITEGASNKEVAEALFLSRKTIERHVSNVFTKLGVRNRAELASKFVSERASAEDPTIGSQ